MSFAVRMALFVLHVLLMLACFLAGLMAGRREERFRWLARIAKRLGQGGDASARIFERWLEENTVSYSTVLHSGESMDVPMSAPMSAGPGIHLDASNTGPVQSGAKLRPRPARVVCRLCGADPAKDPTVGLTRVNEKGVIGIWECVPCCRDPKSPNSRPDEPSTGYAVEKGPDLPASKPDE